MKKILIVYLLKHSINLYVVYEINPAKVAKKYAPYYETE